MLIRALNAWIIHLLRVKGPKMGHGIDATPMVLDDFYFTTLLIFIYLFIYFSFAKNVVYGIIVSIWLKHAPFFYWMPQTKRYKKNYGI